MSFTQPIPVRLNLNLDGFATYYSALVPTQKFTTEVLVSQVMSSSGTIQNAGFEISGNPGVGTGWTFTLKKNGVDTAITFTIMNSTSGSDTTHTVSFSAGDYFTWKMVPTNFPVGFSLQRAYLEIVTSDKSCMYFNEATYATTDNVGSVFNWQMAGNSVANVPVVAPCAGNFTGVWISQNGGVGNIGSFNFMLNKNGTNQDGGGGTVNTQCSMSLGSSGITFANASFSLSVAAGDLLYVFADAVSSPSDSKSISYCYSFIPTGDGAPVGNNSGATTMNTAAGTEYMDCVSALINSGMGASQLNTLLLCSRPFDVGALYIKCGVAGSTKTRTFSMMKNGSAQSLSVAIAGASQTTGNDTTPSHKFRVSSGDTLGFQDVIASSSTGASTITWSFTMATVGGGKGAGGGSSGGKKGGGGGLNVITTGGANMLQIGNPGLDIGITS